MELNNNYHECKIEVKATIPGSLSNFLYCYSKTVNCPAQLEPHFIRKAVSFAKLSKYVRLNIANDFDLWYRKNEDSPALHEVLATIINTEENRTDIYEAAPARLVSSPFRLPGINLEWVLVTRN